MNSRFVPLQRTFIPDERGKSFKLSPRFIIVLNGNKFVPRCSILSLARDLLFSFFLFSRREKRDSSLPKEASNVLVDRIFISNSSSSKFYLKWSSAGNGTFPVVQEEDSYDRQVAKHRLSTLDWQILARNTYPHSFFRRSFRSERLITCGMRSNFSY